MIKKSTGNIMSAACCLVFCLNFLAGCAGTTKFGVEDSGVEHQIIRANAIIRQYKAADFAKVESLLQEDLKRYSGDAYAESRIYNELADLYSYHLLDLERALDADRKLQVLLASAPSTGSLALSANAANNQVLADSKYREEYLNVNASTIRKKSDERLRRNSSLLRGTVPGLQQSYGRGQLEAFQHDTQEDLGKCYPNTQDYYEVASTLIRAEYELYRLTGQDEQIREGYRMILDNRLPLGKVAFAEIDFLSLSDYLRFAYFKTCRSGACNPRLAEYSLQVLNRPYQNIRNYDSRMLYSKMVNNRVNILIDAYYNQKKYDRMLYYISLNKSRMVLEDRAMGQQGSNLKQLHSDTFDRETGLPSEKLFQSKLAEANGYLDFYMDGHYRDEKAGTNTGQGMRASYVVPEATGNSRRIAASEKSVDTFAADYVYVTWLERGRVTAQRHDSVALERFRSTYKGPVDEDAARTKSAGGKKRRISSSGQQTKPTGGMLDLSRLVGVNLPKELTVSPDGWLSGYPLSLLLGSNVVRTLNLFTYGRPDTVNDIRLAGYFNPTLDLPEAEQEKNTLAKLFGNANLFARLQADLGQLHKPLDRNILHLSMHGFFDAAKPDQSFLAFAGSLQSGTGRGPVPGDLSKALKVGDMYRLEQLTNNDLVFTAACQTGLTAKGSANQSEIMGIMRPLLTNNNRNIILTLWDVNSQSAAEFVQVFYKNLAQSKNIRTAFFEARDAIKTRYQDPQHWAPYILIQNN